MKYKYKTTEKVIDALSKGNYKYETPIEEGLFGEEIILPDYNCTIQCRDRRGVISIISRIELEPGEYETKHERLLDACNISNTEWHIKARLFPECVSIINHIPMTAIDDLDDIIHDILYAFGKNIDYKLFDLALHSETDLYRYYEESINRDLRSL